VHVRRDERLDERPAAGAASSARDICCTSSRPPGRSASRSTRVNTGYASCPTCSPISIVQIASNAPAFAASLSGRSRKCRSSAVIRSAYGWPARRSRIDAACSFESVSPCPVTP
jgi:hypothetical protein